MRIVVAFAAIAFLPVGCPVFAGTLDAVREAARIQGEIDAAAGAGGGTVRVGPGEIEMGPLVLKSGVTLELAKGTTLLASTNLADYAGTHAFVYAENAERIAIVGEGTLCGRGWAFKEKEGLSGESQPSEQVPILARFSRCRNVRLEDFTFRDGAAWGVHLRNCDGVTVRRVKAFSHTNESNDGLDVESRNVLIEDCDIDADDDALVIKSESDPTFDIFNIEVRNCTFRSCCNAIKFGTGSHGLWRDVDIHDCVVERAGKSWRFDWRKPSREFPDPSDAFPKPIPGVTNAITGLAAVALEVVDGGRMEDVKVRNIDIRSGYQTPIFIRMGRRTPPPDDRPTCMRNILIENVKGTAESRIACSITGLPYARPTDITLRNIDLRFPGGGTPEEAAKVPRECETDYPDNYMFDQEPLPAWGFYVRHADNVRFEDVKLALDAPDARPMIVREDVKDFSWDDPPDAPGPEAWGFRKDLATPEVDPPLKSGEAPHSLKQPWLKTRISRCFFSPIKRPPLNRDELADDVDYYPTAYLERLVREGVNALWLTVTWRDLVETSFTKRASDAARKLAKLRKTVDKCLEHGIRIYVFFIEPMFVRSGDPLLEAHPELFAEPCEGMRVMCASRPVVRRYIEESVRDLFTQVPRLGGAIAITHGERPTTCFSWVSTADGSRRGTCPECNAREPWELHNLLAESVVRGIRAAGSSAEFISWLYQPDVAATRGGWVAECARHVPDGVTVQYNFESGAVRDQLGKVRHGGDYWLSYPGPSDAFRAIADAARDGGGRLGAKIQVCNSHEMATVPYVPVPGLLYRKYRALRDMGVSSVMQCWYFGSYPGIMNRAAGELAYEDFKDGEDAFLRRLAVPYWGGDAEAVAGLWKRLSDAYAEYPLSNNMQYYGPFAAGVTWPLRPDVDLAPLGRTWMPFDNPSGDLIGECLENHSLAEVRELASRMMRLSELPGIDALAERWKGNRERSLDLGVMRALGLHFRSAYDIFDFYQARAEAVFASRRDHDRDGALAAFGRMEEAVAREEAVTREMLPLAEADSRLGYHSEAQVHQYHPAKLRWRLGKLAETRRRMAEIRKTLESGGPYPESAFEKSAPRLAVGGGWAGEVGGHRLRIEEIADGLKVTVRAPDRRPVRFSTLDALGLSVYRTWTFDADGKAYDRTINRAGPNHLVSCAAAKPLADGGYELTFTLLAKGWGDDVRMRPGWAQLQVGDDVNQWDFAPAWPVRTQADPRLNLRHEIRDFARLTWEPEVSVLRQGREGLVRCAFSETEDMVVRVCDLVNEWVYMIPRALSTRDFAKGELVHAGPDDFPATQLGDFGFMSGNHGSYFAHLQTVKGHGFTSEAIGSVVTHESGERFVIVGVPDGDRLVLHPEGRPGEDPGFKYVPTGRFTAGEKTWEPSATSREQLWPMSRYRGFRWQLADGSEAPDGREARSSRIDLVLEHDVLDPRGVLAYLKAHPGTSGRPFGTVKAFALVDTSETAGADADFMKIPTLMTVRTTYRYDGRCCRQVLRKTTYTAPIRSVSVLDVCYCWNQGDGKWDDVRLYIPRLKPVTLKGKDGTPDVRCDFTSVEKMSYPPWCVNTHLTREDSTDPANPPDRFIRCLSRGDRRLGVALGYSLLNGVSALGNGWPNRETIYHFWDTGKMYPYVMNLHHVPAGTTYEHRAYTQFFDPRQEPDATAFYCHREGDALVVYMDFHRTVKDKRVVLPAETAGRGFEVLEKTPSVTLRVDTVDTDGSVVLDVANGYGTLVLKIRDREP